MSGSFDLFLVLPLSFFIPCPAHSAFISSTLCSHSFLVFVLPGRHGGDSEKPFPGLPVQYYQLWLDVQTVVCHQSELWWGTTLTTSYNTINHHNLIYCFEHDLAFISGSNAVNNEWLLIRACVFFFFLLGAYFHSLLTMLAFFAQQW